MARLLSHRSRSGHTALTWAVVCSDYESCQILIENGASPGVPDDVLAASADLIAQCWRRHKWHKSKKRMQIESVIQRWGADTKVREGWGQVDLAVCVSLSAKCIELTVQCPHCACGCGRCTRC